MDYQFLQWSEDGGALLLRYREAAGERAGGLLLVRCRERRSQRPLGAGLTAGKPGRADPKKGREWKPDGGVWRRLRGRDGGGERWAGRKDPLPRKRVRVPEMGC